MDMRLWFTGSICNAGDEDDVTFLSFEGECLPSDCPTESEVLFLGVFLEAGESSCLCKLTGKTDSSSCGSSFITTMSGDSLAAASSDWSKCAWIGWDNESVCGLWIELSPTLRPRRMGVESLFTVGGAGLWPFNQTGSGSSPEHSETFHKGHVYICVGWTFHLGCTMDIAINISPCNSLLNEIYTLNYLHWFGLSSFSPSSKVQCLSDIIYT